MENFEIEQPPPLRELPPDDAAKKPKPCRDCGELRPLSDYGRDRQQPDGKKTICKECWRRREEKAAEQRMLVQQKQVSKEFAERVVQGKAIPETPDILEGIIQFFGGVHEFCKEFVADYYASEPGSASRKRAQEVVVKLTDKHTTRMVDQHDVRGMSDDELELLLQTRMQEAVVKLGNYQKRKRENTKRGKAAS